MFARPCLNRLAFITITLLVCTIQLKALIIITNCPPVGTSLSQPKRIQSGCPAIAPVNYFGVLPQFSSAGIYCFFGYSGVGAFNFGLVQSDSNGAFNWQVACSNGVIAPLNGQGRVFSLQDFPAGISNVTCCGVYNRSGGTFVPVFEERLPINNYTFVGQAVLDNGTFVLSLNRSNSVALLGLSSSGSLLWAKQFTSADFPSVGASPSTPGRAVAVSSIGTNNVLLSLSANENVGTTNAVTVLVRVDSTGVVQWSKKLEIPLVDSPPSSSGSQVFVLPSGDVLVMTSDYDLQAATVINYTHLTKVTPDGRLAWSRKIAGAVMVSGPKPVGAQGSLLLDLISFGTSSGHGVCGLLDSNGQITSLVQIDPPGSGTVRVQGVSTAAGKIYFAGSSDKTPIIGSSSLTLTNFTAKEYLAGPLSSQNLTLLEDGRLAFAGLETNLNTSHLVLLNSNLGEVAGCGLFTASTLNTSSPSVTVITNSLALSDITLTNSNLTLSLTSTQLQFQLRAFAEQALCTTNCEYTLLPGAVSLTKAGGSTNLQVAVTSLGSCSWAVVNPCTDWLTVSPMNGTGSGQLTLSATSNTGNSRSCALSLGGVPLTVTQAGDINLLADAVDAPNLVWTTGGNAEWSGQAAVTHDGVDAGQSGTISDSQESWMETSVTGPGTLTFWWKVSSQGGSDRLRFYINGLQQNSITGEVDWRQMTYNLAAGSNVLRWRYTKDLSGSGGQDRGWVDQVVWAPTTTCSFALSTSQVAVGPDGGSTNVDLTVATGSSCDWTTLNPCPDWLVISPTNGTGNGQVSIFASANNTGNTRNCTLMVGGNPVAVVQSALSSGTLLVQYNPTGPQTSATPVPPAVVAPGVTASSLQEIGFETTWNNTDALPIGRITTSATVDPTVYLTFTVQAGNGQSITFTNLSFDKQSYLNAGPSHASIRSSLDSYGADIAVVTVNPAGFQSLNFDLSTLPPASAPVTFRIYLYGAPSFTDWADLVGTAKSGNGLRVNGMVGAAAATILIIDPGFASGKFGFDVTGPSGQGVVIESSVDLQNWAPVQTNSFGAGSLFFSDPQSASSGARFYRARLQ
jgi:hypothetical protein